MGVIPVRFCEKLDFLMNITKTSNSALGQKVKLDASYVSRLRKGQRSALKNAACIRAMAEYFARNCREEYQRRAVCEALGTGAASASALPEQLAAWLTGESEAETAAVESFLSGFSGFSFRPAAAAPPPPPIAAAGFPQEDVSIYYGIEGKRRAAVDFLTGILAQDRPQTLLLFSDEATDWMTADPGFASRWACLMGRLLAAGHRIKIIHTVSRDPDEMLSAIRQWMPLYMTGLIEPYFYPRRRDGVFKRTLFVAPGVSAVVSNSVGGSIEHAANVLTRNAGLIASYAEEFCRYLSLCRPLMRVYTAKDRAAYFEALLAFEKAKSSAFIRTQSLSWLTMPEDVTRGIVGRLGGSQADFGALRESRARLFEKNIKSNSFSEIVPLFGEEQVKSGRVKVAFSEMMLGGTACYTPEEYIRHLEHLAELLRTYQNFHVHLIREEAESPYMVYAREELGVIIAKTSAPPVSWAISEPNLAAAFWDYLQSLTGERAYRQPNDAESEKRLLDYIQRLKQSAE